MQRPLSASSNSRAVITAGSFRALTGVVLCLSLGLELLSTNTLAYMPGQVSVRHGVDLHAISYRANWALRLRSAAQHAYENDEPYLANRLWEQLARAGDREAAYQLGLFYDTNTIEARDARRAVYWYQHAAAAGEIHAQHNLGVAYAKGDGVQKDVAVAIKWWELAASHGNTDSQYNLGILYAAGRFGVKKNVEEAKHWWHKAALHGDAMAQYNLGTLYVNAAPRDYCEATRWWKEAARNGVEQASLALRVIRARQDYRACP
ncbi:MAG: hypothetical protein GC149_08620 [Gammaproteobacteria bacterium]|nr:hypothetical protein [Gammaproteobacteria bacterium]